MILGFLSDLSPSFALFGRGMRGVTVARGELVQYKLICVNCTKKIPRYWANFLCCGVGAL
jgi:hypothetical protein